MRSYLCVFWVVLGVFVSVLQSSLDSVIQSYLRGDRSLEREIDGALSPGRCRGCSYCELQVDARVCHLVFAWVRFGLFATDVIAIFQSVNDLVGLFSYQAVVAD